MALSPADFTSLIQRVRQREELAATELVEHFRPQVLRAVQHRLIRLGLRNQVDAEDVCQTIFANLFTRLTAGELTFQTPDDLAKLLQRSARNQVYDELRKILAASRGGGATLVGSSSESEDDFARIAANESTPSKIVANAELIDEIFRRLTHEERLIFDQRNNKRDWAEIAQALGSTPEALRKKLARAYDRIRRELGIELPPQT